MLHYLGSKWMFSSCGVFDFSPNSLAKHLIVPFSFKLMKKNIVDGRVGSGWAKLVF